MSPKNPCQHLIRSPTSCLSPPPLPTQTYLLHAHSPVLPSFPFKGKCLTCCYKWTPSRTQGVHPLLLSPKAQPFYIISPCEFLLTWGFNNHLCENSSQIYTSTQTFLLRCTPTYSTPDWESLPRCSHFKFLPVHLFFLYSLISENVVAIYRIARGRSMRAITTSALPRVRPLATCLLSTSDTAGPSWNVQ